MNGEYKTIPKPEKEDPSKLNEDYPIFEIKPKYVSSHSSISQRLFDLFVKIINLPFRFYVWFLNTIMLAK